MKKIILSCIIATAIVSAKAQIKMPAPSPTQTIKQEFAMGNMELTYSRPVAKGRKIYGDLVPFGAIWRTGANSATKIKFSEPVNFGGTNVDSGTYLIYTFPNKDSWEIVLNKGLKNGGVADYKETENAAKIAVSTMKMKTPLESFTMQFADVKAQSCNLHIMWEKTAVSVPITVNITDKLKKQFEDSLSGNNASKFYFNAANFYDDYLNDKAKALELTQKATTADPKAFWKWNKLAALYLETGNKAEAIKAANIGLPLATEAKNNDYTKMLNATIKKATK